MPPGIRSVPIGFFPRIISSGVFEESPSSFTLGPLLLNTVILNRFYARRVGITTWVFSVSGSGSSHLPPLRFMVLGVGSHEASPQARASGPGSWLSVGGFSRVLARF